MPTSRVSLPSLIVHPDINTLSRGDWLELRREGIGGSDAGTVMGVNPYSTLRDLYYDKIGCSTANEEDGWVAKEYGHLLEDLVARVFAKKTGFTVWQDNAMYAHPEYPFMLANLDRMTRDMTGVECGLECKTGNPNTRFRWDNNKVPFWYEVQVRHYMAVRNLDRFYIACLFGNNESEFVWRRIDRDLEFEASLMEMEDYFWHENVQKHIPPDYTEKPDLCLDSIKQYFASLSSRKATFHFPATYSYGFKEVIRLKEEAKGLESKKKAIQEEIKGLTAELSEVMGMPGTGVCIAAGKRYELVYKQDERTVFQKPSVEKLKANYPDIYDSLCETKTSVKLDISEM